MNLTEDIINYVKYLQTDAKLYVSIKPTRFDTEVNRNLAFLDMHSNPYCLFIKSKKDSKSKCVAEHTQTIQQSKKELIFSMCSAGVWEFSYPVYYGELIMCMIIVSGYCLDERSGHKAIESYSNDYNRDKKLMREMYDKSIEREVPSMEKIMAIINPIKYMLGIAYKEFPPSQNNELYTRVLHYLNEHHNEKISIENIANHLHYSPSAICHVFKKRNGMGINAYLTELRMKEAKNLVENTKLSITEIAYAVGIPDSGYFSKLFKKSFGLSPMSIRKKSDN